MPHHTLHDHFDAYLEELAPKLGHSDYVSSFKNYCYGLMLSLPRKSIAPSTTSVALAHVLARHQAPHHLVAKSPWSDHALLTEVAQWVLPHLLTERGSSNDQQSSKDPGASGRRNQSVRAPAA